MKNTKDTNTDYLKMKFRVFDKHSKSYVNPNNVSIDGNGNLTEVSYVLIDGSLDKTNNTITLNTT